MNLRKILSLEKTNLKLGLTNQNYLIKNKYVMRISPAKINYLFTREFEKQLVLSGALKKINVKCMTYFSDNNNNYYYVTQFISNAYNFDQKAIHNDDIIEAAKLIKSLHQVEYKDFGFKNLPIWNITDRLSMYKLSSGASKKYTEYLNKYEASILLEFKNYVPDKIVLSHNDLSGGNFMKHKNKYYLLDYEYCSLNDELFDIAAFITEKLIQPEYIHLIPFWVEQFNLSKYQKTRIYHWIKYQALTWSYWALTFQKFCKDREQKGIYDIILKLFKGVLDEQIDLIQLLK